MKRYKRRKVGLDLLTFYEGRLKELNMFSLAPLVTEGQRPWCRVKEWLKDVGSRGVVKHGEGHMMKGRLPVTKCLDVKWMY